LSLISFIIVSWLADTSWSSSGVKISWLSIKMRLS
jgi:hypothetical protein